MPVLCRHAATQAIYFGYGGNYERSRHLRKESNILLRGFPAQDGRGHGKAVRQGRSSGHAPG